MLVIKSVILFSQLLHIGQCTMLAEVTGQNALRFYESFKKKPSINLPKTLPKEIVIGL